MEPRLRVKYEAEKFVAWQQISQENAQHYEPELAYPAWDRLCEACVDFLVAVPPDCWQSDEHELLLYVLCHDDDCRLVLTPLKIMPEAVIALAKLALDHNARFANIELAGLLGEFAGRSDAEEMLLRLVKDPDECTSRYALMSLARIGSPRVEEFVQRAWATGDQYQRLGSLHSLFTARSAKLAEYLDRADADGREFLVNLARKIRNREGEYSNNPDNS